MAKTTIEFSPTAEAELGRLAHVQGKTKKSVLADALGLYSFVQRELAQNQNFKLAIVEEEARIVKLVVMP